MSKRNPRIPSYRFHKQSGQAVVTLSDALGGRRDVLLGKYRSPESRAEYARFLAEWEANGWRLPRPTAAPADYTVNELILAYWRFAEKRIARKSKVQPSQQDRRKRAPKRGPGDHYTSFSYGGAVDRACTAALAMAVAQAMESVTVCGTPISRPEQKPLRRALRETARRGVHIRLDRSARGAEALMIDGRSCGIGYWHPNQLRHTAATEIRRTAGIDAARAQLGHSSPNVTEIYAELDAEKAAEVMERLG